MSHMSACAEYTPRRSLSPGYAYLPRSAVLPFVGTVDAAATALQPLALNEVEEHAGPRAEEAPVPASTARAIGGLGSQQVVRQPMQPRESPTSGWQRHQPASSSSAAAAPTIDYEAQTAPARDGGDATPPELSLPAAWQPPASGDPPPPQPFASEPMRPAGRPAEVQQWQQLPMPGSAPGQGLHAAASAQLVRESGTAGEADGPLAPQSRHILDYGWGALPRCPNSRDSWRIWVCVTAIRSPILRMCILFLNLIIPVTPPTSMPTACRNQPAQFRLRCGS